MSARSLDRAIDRLARELGVVSEWVDAWGATQHVSQVDLLGVLSALTGRSLDSEASIVGTTAETLAAQPKIEPVIVAWDGILELRPKLFDITTGTIILEDGESIEADIVDGAVRQGRPLPPGYHELSLNQGAHTAHVFSAPPKAHPAPIAALGLVAPTYSLRSADSDRGIGTVAEMRKLADLCHDAGVEVVGTLPLLATFPDQPSPYAPVSRRAWSELFVDPSTIPDWSEDHVDVTRDPSWVDYEKTGFEIREALARYSAHVSDTPRLRAQRDVFVQRSVEMQRYARFRALGDRHGRNWRAWPQSVQSDPARVRYHETVQWLMDKQLSALSADLGRRGQYLYLDLPIGCHPDGFDIWDNPDLFAPAGLGAPPDPLFVGGQDWGLPASIPWVARQDGHLNFRKAIRHQLSVAGLLRIDHVMGIHRTWWVPHGAGANRGAYVMQPTEEMFAIICIESDRAGAGVVGENLGTVPPEIMKGLVDHNILGITVAQDAANRPATTDLVAMSSHDTPAFAAWWDGLDIDDMLDLGAFDDDRAVSEREIRQRDIAALEEFLNTSGPIATRDALMEWIAGTDAAIALLNLDDLLMEVRRQNVPGTDSERPNWRLRNARTIDDLAKSRDFVEKLTSLARIRHGERC